MPRSKELQELFDTLGEEGYNELKRINKNISKKLYYNENKDKINIKQKIYRDTHKEEISANKKIYYKEVGAERQQTPEGIKSNTLAKWKHRGITFGDMTPSDYYDNIYLPMKHCQSCNKEFNNINKNDQKNADHKHDPLNLCNIRGTICFQCNSQDQWRNRLTPDSIYNQYLTKPPLTDTLINTNKNLINKG